MVKVDIQKAFDSLEWCFLEQVLKKLGFSRRMLTWIMMCVKNVKYCFQINGVLSNSRQAKRGLRQRDPMSPYLFIFF